MTVLRTCLVIVVTSLAAAGWAAEALDLVTEETRIELGKTREWTFPALPMAGRTALLEFTIRTHAPSPSGSTYMLRLHLNGQVVRAACTRRLKRLVNKPLSWPYSPTLTLHWAGPDQWRVVYAPDFEVANQAPHMNGQAYRFVLDVSDLVREEGQNLLVFEHTGTADLAARVEGDIPLVMGMLRLLVEDRESPLLHAADLFHQPVNRGEPTPPPAPYQHAAFNTGGFEISVAGVTYPFETRISYPHAGFNHMEPSPEPVHQGQQAWFCSLRAGQDPLIVGRGPDYEVHRSIIFGPRRVEISDTFINLHRDRELGLIVRHQTTTSDERRIHLAGDPDPAKNRYYANANPTVFIAGEGHGIGILCEDDVFRNQATLFYDQDENAAGVMTEMLYLPPGGQQTLRWAVYPVASEDYFDFINLVREDWGSNYTVEGPWAFFVPDPIIDMPADALGAALKRLGIRYMCHWGGWVDPKAESGPQRTIGFGTFVTEGQYWADYRRRLRAAIEKIHSVAPEVRCLVYYDSQRDSWPDAPQRYPDSKLTNSAGQQLSTEWGGIYSLTWSMVATLENSFGKKMLDAVDVYMKEIGADGLYWDEMEGVSFGEPLLTWSMHDGVSCIIDPDTLEVKQKVGVTTLLGESHRLAVIDRVRALGGSVMGNGPTSTRALLQRQVQRMVEIQHNDVWCYEGNLDTPLGYASNPMEFSNFVRGVKLATLLVGTRYNYEHQVSPHLFPFTPIELHAGYLLGRERIIATHSGNYGWHGERTLARVLLFDTEGRIVPHQFVTTVADEARTRVELEEGQMVILERLPVTVTAGGAPVLVHALQEHGGELSITAQSTQPWTLHVPGREVPVAAGRQQLTVSYQAG